MSNPSSTYLDMVSEFLDNNPDVTSPMPNGSTLLALFLDNSNILSTNPTGNYGMDSEQGFRCLSQLIDAGSDPNTTFDSQRLLNNCLEKGFIQENQYSEEFILHLIQKADVNTAGRNGNFPLHQTLIKERGNSLSRFPACAIIKALIARGSGVNQANAAGASPFELLLDFYKFHQHELLEISMLLIKGGANTTLSTSTGQTLFDKLALIPEKLQVPIFKALLEADINSSPDFTFATYSGWRFLWRFILDTPSWGVSKVLLARIERGNDRPKLSQFPRYTFIIAAQHHLGKHKSLLVLWKAGDLNKESVQENYEAYCAILRDCRERQAAIDVSWYTFLLDLMDFK